MKGDRHALTNRIGMYKQTAEMLIRSQTQTNTHSQSQSTHVEQTPEPKSSAAQLVRQQHGVRSRTEALTDPQRLARQPVHKGEYCALKQNLQALANCEAKNRRQDAVHWGI